MEQQHISYPGRPCTVLKKKTENWKINLFLNIWKKIQVPEHDLICMSEFLDGTLGWLMGLFCEYRVILRFLHLLNPTFSLFNNLAFDLY